METCKTRKFARSLILTTLVLVVCLHGTAVRAEKIEQLSQQGYVNDFAGALDADTRQKLNALCLELDQKANAQIAVVTIHSLEGDAAQDFANRLFMKWGVGPKGSDRGVMILLAIDDHQYWTEVGYGLEPILPDGKVGGFGREMLPLLRQNQYSGAVLEITSEVANVIAQDRGVSLSQAPAPPAAQENPGGPSAGIPGWAIQLIVLFFIFGGWRLLGFLFALLGWSSYRRGRGYRSGWMGPMGGWGGSGGGNWGGGGFGGGGFGGFGGGASGGGGAGGGW